MEDNVLQLILKKIESLEMKVDRSSDILADFKIQVQKEQYTCKADCKEDISNLKTNYFKLLIYLASSGTIGGGIAHALAKVF